jgi:hypothetical protein
MNKRGIGFGLFLLMAGIVWLLMNMGIITWSVFASLRVLWPLIIIAVGINMMFRNRTVKALTWLLTAAIVIGYGYFYEKPDSREETGMGKITIEREDGITAAELKIGLGGIKLDIGSGTGNLVEADTTLSRVKQTYGSKEERAYVSFSRKDYDLIRVKGSHRGSILLNEDVLWDLIVNTGAVDLDMDLADLMVENLEIRGGVGDIDLVLGDRHRETDIVIEGAVMNVEIKVPSDAGVRIERSGLAFSISTEGGWDRSGKHLQTDGYDEADIKINIDVSLVAGKLRIKRI